MEIQDCQNDNITDVFEEFAKKIGSGDIPPEFNKIFAEDFWNLI